MEQLRGSFGRSIWLRCAGVVTAVGLVGWTFSGLDAARVGATLRAGGPALLWALLPMGLGFALESLGWAWAFRRFGLRLPLLGLLRTRVASEALALTLPAGALLSESSTPFLLGRHCGLSVETSVAGMAIRKYLLLASQAVYISVSAGLGAVTLERASRELLHGPGLSALLLGLGALVFVAAPRDGEQGEEQQAGKANARHGESGGYWSRCRTTLPSPIVVPPMRRPARVPHALSSSR